MKTNKLRIIIPLAILAIGGIGFVAHLGTGSLSAIGFQDISVLCPLGALSTMIASKTAVPHALISLLVALVAIILLGRAFCAWICPATVVSKLRDVFKRQPSEKDDETAVTEIAAPEAPEGADAVAAPLTAAEKKAITGGCSACHAKPNNSRYVVLGGALLSAAIFGFPVFCLICPIGLSFALVFALILLFGAGDVTWSLILIPALLLVELVFFRKWCSHLCPLSALMSLVGKMNRTFRPTIDDSKCLETSRGAECGHCAKVCEVGIDPRHPESGTSWSECTKCRACVEGCPAGAIKMPLLAKAQPDKGAQKPTADAPAE